MFDTLNETYGSMDNSIRPSGYDTFEGAATTLANFLISAAAAIATIGLAYAFILFLTTQGDPKAAQKAVHAATYSAVALFVSLMAYVIKIVAFGTIGAS